MSFHQLIWVTLKCVLNGVPPKITEEEYGCSGQHLRVPDRRFPSWFEPSHAQYVCQRVSCGAVWVGTWKDSPMGRYKSVSYQASLAQFL